MFSKEKILALAPDVMIAERAKELATARKWVVLEGNEKLIWGLCKGNGNNTYRCQIELTHPTLGCNCPSRKFPCKHVLALFLLYLQSDAFRITHELPEWVMLWLDEIQQKESPIKKVRTEAAIEKSESDKAKRRAARLALMKQGMLDLEVWLCDIIRQGMASTEGQSYNFWNDISARMVDTQLGAIGPKIRSMQLLHANPNNWSEQMLMALAELYLMARGFGQLEQLPAPLREQLLRVAGITDNKSDLLLEKGHTDEWGVLGQFEGINIDNGSFRRTWLKGRTAQKMALILEFDYRNEGFETNWNVGEIYDGALIYYPASFPLRALLKNQQSTGNRFTKLKGYENGEELKQHYAAALSVNPWLSAFPAVIEQVIPAKKLTGFFLIDENKKALPILPREQTGWQLMALSGGYPITVFGEWDGETFLPLSIAAEGRFVQI